MPLTNASISQLSLVISYADYLTYKGHVKARKYTQNV
jgi:hypothetical protein